MGQEVTISSTFIILLIIIAVIPEGEVNQPVRLTSVHCHVQWSRPVRCNVRPIFETPRKAQTAETVDFEVMEIIPNPHFRVPKPRRLLEVTYEALCSEGKGVGIR